MALAPWLSFALSASRSACFLASFARVGSNLACKSAAAFCPSFVLAMAFWMLMIPTFVAAEAPCAKAPGAPMRSVEMRITVYFKRLTPCVLTILIYSKCTADREFEGGMLFKERGGCSVVGDSVQKSGVVREV